MKRMYRIIARTGLLLLACLLLTATALLLPVLPRHAPTRFFAAPDADSATIVAGARYRAGPIGRFLLGAEYREVWVQPIQVEVLHLDRFDGGLKPVKEGGGVQTRTLHFVAGSGRRYVFRSSDKENSRLLDNHLGRSLIARLLNDQTSSSHPASALVAAPLQAAAGLRFPHPRLVLLPPDPSLGVYAATYGGLLGMLLENPSDYQREPPDSAAADSVAIDTQPLLALLNAAGTHRIDAPAFLTARLLDFFLNDWDRHQGQWRWSPRTGPGGTVWTPIPVDRDQAFSWYDGLLLSLVRLRSPKLAEFGPEYPGLQGLTWNSAALDRRFLAGLSREVWESTAAALEASLTDAVIEAAVRRMPEPYWRLSGARLAATLKQRRAGLREIASRFYLHQARSPELHVASTGEVARVSYQEDGSVEVRLETGGGNGAPPSGLARRFIPAETELIELHLHGGSNALLVSGTAPSRIGLRVFDAQGRPAQVPGLVR